MKLGKLWGRSIAVKRAEKEWPGLFKEEQRGLHGHSRTTQQATRGRGGLEDHADQTRLRLVRDLVLH